MSEKTSKDKILEDMHKAAERVDGKLTQEKFIEFVDYSIQAVYSLFDSWNKAKKAANSCPMQAINVEE